MGLSACRNMAMGQNPGYPPVNIPIPTKIDKNGWCTYPKMVPLVLTHSHIFVSMRPPYYPPKKERTIQAGFSFFKPAPGLPSLQRRTRRTQTLPPKIAIGLSLLEKSQCPLKTDMGKYKNHILRYDIRSYSQVVVFAENRVRTKVRGWSPNCEHQPNMMNCCTSPQGEATDGFCTRQTSQKLKLGQRTIPKLDMAVAQNSRARVTQLLVHVSTYQGSIFGTVFLSHTHIRTSSRPLIVSFQVSSPFRAIVVKQCSRPNERSIRFIRLRVPRRQTD